MTRRDLQLAAREKGRPWDAGKNFDASAPIGPLRRAAEVPDIARRRLWLEVNGQVRQDANISQLLFPIETIISHLSKLYSLEAGDLIMTGTPAGVGAVLRGDRLVGRVEGLSPIDVTIE
jgi:fumarylpyruvate hydrolase